MSLPEKEFRLAFIVAVLDEIEEGESIVRLGTAARECEKKMTKSRLKRRGILLFKKNEWKTKEMANFPDKVWARERMVF